MDNRTERTYYPQIDTLRFFAFLLVFLSHLPPIAGSSLSLYFSQMGAYGVDLFFVISAFLLFDLLRKEYGAFGKINIGYFFLRRALRIWPLYFFFIAVTVFYTVAVQDDGSLNFPKVAGLLLFVDNIVTFVAQDFNPIFATGHLWTISLEEQFYLVIPFLTLLLCRLKPRTSIGILTFLFVSSIVLRWMVLAMGMRHPSVWVMHITHLEPFIVGLLIAYAYNRPNLPSWIAFGGLTTFLLAFSVSHYVAGPPFANFHPHNVFVITGVSIACGGLFLYTLVRSDDVAYIWRNKQLVFLGKISYGLYIWHMFVIPLYRSRFLSFERATVDGFLAWAFHASVILALTIGISILSYFLLEKPFLKLKSKFTLVRNRAA